MDDLMLVYAPDGQLFTGNVLYGDHGGERGAVTVSSFEKVPFRLMIARLAEQVSVFVEKEEKIGVTIRRSDLGGQPPVRFDEETILMLHADPVAVIRTLSPAPKKVFIHRADPATTSPLRVGYDALASTFGDALYVRRREDQIECPGCGRWASIVRGVVEPRLVASLCRSMACKATFPVDPCSDRWARIPTSSLLSNPNREKLFFPRAWNKPGPWVTREDLEKKYNDWLMIKKEFVQ